MPATAARVLAGKLWRIGVVRGITALALGGYVISQAPTAAAGVARASAAYWMVDGLLALWAAAFAATLMLSRMFFLLRGGIALVAGLTLLGLPLALVFGPWQPGQVLLLMVVAAVMLTVIAAQILAVAFDVLICLEVRRRIPGDWSYAFATALSAVLGVIAAATFVAPAALLGRILGASAVVGGLGLLATAARLRGDPEPSALPAYPHER